MQPFVLTGITERRLDARDRAAPGISAAEHIRRPGSFGRLYDKLYDNMQGAALREEVKS